MKKLPPTAAASAKPAKGGAAPAPGALDTFKYKHTSEDAEALAAELIPAKYATDLADKNWKVRLAALEEMATWVEGSADELDCEVVVRFLAKKCWNDKIFQVCSIFLVYSRRLLVANPIQIGPYQVVQHPRTSC